MEKSSAKALVTGSIWAFAARWGMRAIGLVSTLVVARLLTPEDFGVFVIATMILGLLETFTYAGVDLALLRPGNESRAHYDTAWTIQIIQGLVVAIALLAIAPFSSHLFNEPRSAEVIHMLAVRSFITAFSNIGVVKFRKELNFSAEFRFVMMTKVANTAIVITLAFVVGNYMALAGAMLLGGLVELIGSYWVHPYRPRISLERRDEMWGFSVGIIFSRAGSFLGKKVDQFVLANQVGTPAIGGYHVAGELATLATNEVVMPIRRALFPTLSSAMDRKEERNALVVGAMNAVALICIPMGVGMSFVAADVVPLLLGEQWVSAIPAMRWLALYGALSALVLGLELPLWVTKNIKKAAWLSWGEFLLLIPVTLMFTRFWGIEGAAIGRAATSLGIFVVMLYLVSREFGIDSGRLWAVIVNPLAASALMYLALHQLPLDAVSIRPVRLAASVLSGALLYGALILGWWKLRGCPDGMETRIMEFLAKARNKK